MAAAADSQNCYEKIDREIARTNQILSRCKLRRDKCSLALRGKFPPKPTQLPPGLGQDGGIVMEKRQHLYLGLQATKEGLKAAIAIAKQIDSDLMFDRFDWSPWLKEKDKPAETVKEWLARLVKAHWAKTPQDPNKLNSWKKDYQCVYDLLPSEKSLTLELLQEAILENSEAGTRTRRRWCLACGRLADFAGLDGRALRKLSTYNPIHHVKPRDLPDDEVIAETLDLISNPGWRTVYILMAVFGLRDHEVFRIQLEGLDQDPPLVEVHDNSKTGHRMAYACHADQWGTAFYLTSETAVLPKVETEGKANNSLGTKVTQMFAKYGVSAKLGKVYNLRHAWARRAFEQEWPVELAARSMGHDVRVHVQTYQKFMEESSYFKVYKRLRQGRSQT